MELFKILGTIAINGADQAQKDLDKTSEKAKGTSDSISDVGEKSNTTESKTSTAFSKIGSAAAKVGTAVATGIAAASAAVVAFAKKSIDAGEQFDSSMSQVMATMGYTVEELNTEGSEAAETMQKLRDFAQQMGSTTAFSASEAADALNYMALAGYDAETSMSMLPTVLNLAAAGGIDLASASDMVTDAQTALGLSIDDTVVMVDQMAKAASKSNTSVSQLGEAFLTVGGNAKNLKGGTNELSTVLGVMADNGIKASEAGTHLRNIMLAMNPTTDAAAAAFDQLGLKAYDDEGSLRSMSDIFTDLSEAMSDMTDQERSRTISAIFNKTDLAAVNALLDTSADRWQELSAAIADSEGSAEAMAGVQLDNLSGDITLFQSALEGAKIAVSDELTPTIRKFVQFGSNGISELTEAFKEGGLSGAMSKFGELLSDALSMIMDMLPDVIDAGLKLLSAFIGGIVDNLPKMMNAVVKLLPKILQAIEKIFFGIVDALPSLMNTIFSALPTLIPQLINAVIGMVVYLMEHFAEIIQPIIDNLPSIITSIIDAIIGNLPAFIKGFISLVIGIVNAMSQIIVPLIEAMPDIIASIVIAIIDNLPILISGVIQVVGAVLSAVWEILGTIYAPLGEFFATILEAISGAFMNVANWFYDTIIAPIAEFFTGLWNGIVNAFHTVIDPWIEIIKRAWDQIIKPWLEPIIDWFQGMFNTVVSKFHEFFDPIVGWAKSTWEGIKDVFSSVADFFGNIFGKAWEKVKNVFSIGGKIFSGIKEGISDMFKNIVNKIIQGINKVVSVPFNAINNMLSKLKSISILGVSPFDWVKTFNVPEIPQLAEGGVLKKGQVGYLEGDGDEAVVPLSQNTEWIDRVAEKINNKGSNADVISKLDELIKAITSMNIVLDTGLMVGEMTPAFDTSLGNLYAAKGRGR